MSELSIKNVDNIEELQLKVKELRPNESVYIIEVGDMEIRGIEYVSMLLEKKGISHIIVRRMPEIKELKKL